MAVRAHARNEAARLAVRVFEHVLEAMEGGRLVERAVEIAGDHLFLQGRHVDLSGFDRVFVCGAGKASVAMARPLVEALGSRIAGGLLIAKTSDVRSVGDLPVLLGGHPIPDSRSLEAGEAMLRQAEALGERDLVLFLLSGGASALMEAPVEGVSLEDLRQLNDALLRSGADIRSMNGIRRSLSRIKGGGLARAFAPATAICLVLSDVIGNDLSAIGSGPLYAPRRASAPPHHLLGVVPEALRERIRWESGEPTPPVDHFVVGSVSLAVHEAADCARALGLEPLPFGEPMQGEARRMARRICREAEYRLGSDGRPLALIFGGETTVTVKGDGVGGRCQEMAAAASLPLSRMGGCAFLAAGTDGNDGPTDAAGGLVDETSCDLALFQGRSARQALRRNDAYAYLQACDGLVFTDPTGTNVNDLALFVSVP